jgi:major membrane immunogen (membrane-anchored lipoprotein)
MNNPKTTVAMIAAALVAAALLLTACGSSETVHNRLVSPEQSAADLKRALDAGIISQDEYQEEMEKLQDAH